MSEHRSTVDSNGSPATPREPRTYRYPHNLRYVNHDMALDSQDAPTQSWTERVPTGKTTVTCPCGLDTGAVPSDEARLVYEEHRNHIRDEIAGKPHC
ncbi:hypothetical protein ACFWUW_24320 [Streptomyces sp. NPDC058655]|uniref:hypothetical protein n=1 Tax=Streptomyces sp. NPDC058655 TaxID=3346577 RepID=UPI00364651CA